MNQHRKVNIMIANKILAMAVIGTLVVLTVFTLGDSLPEIDVLGRIADHVGIQSPTTDFLNELNNMGGLDDALANPINR